MLGHRHGHAGGLKWRSQSRSNCERIPHASVDDATLDPGLSRPEIPLYPQKSHRVLVYYWWWWWWRVPRVGLLLLAAACASCVCVRVRVYVQACGDTRGTPTTSGSKRGGSASLSSASLQGVQHRAFVGCCAPKTHAEREGERGREREREKEREKARGVECAMPSRGFLKLC